MRNILFRHNVFKCCLLQMCQKMCLTHQQKQRIFPSKLCLIEWFKSLQTEMILLKTENIVWSLNKQYWIEKTSVIWASAQINENHLTLTALLPGNTKRPLSRTLLLIGNFYWSIGGKNILSWPIFYWTIGGKNILSWPITGYKNDKKNTCIYL